MAGRPESPIDPGAGPVQRFAAELRELRTEAGSPTYRVMARRTGHGASTLSQAAAGERLPTLPVALAYVRACGGDPEEWERRWRQAAAEEREASALSLADDPDAEPPYRGLARFEPADHDRFFGRERLVDEIARVALASRCSAVVGPSGSGKSSLLRAGLIPLLQRAQGGERPSALRILTPGDRPMVTHGALFRPAEAPGDTWLVVDQFEEVFTLCRDPAERQEFIDRLLSAADPDSRLRVVLGLRADFYGRCLRHHGLVEVLRTAAVPVGPMSGDELREAIVKPAASDGLIVERALTARLVAEAEGEPGGLPLMSHALLETWRRRRGRALTLDGYQAAGGLHGAIARTAEDLYARLSPDQARLARGLLLRLVTPGEGTPDTRRPAERAELAQTVAGDREEVLERLAEARLITLDGDIVDLAHEALLTAWPRLRGWIEEDRQRLLLHRRLTEDARAWEDLGRDAGALYRGARLATAEETFGAGGAAAELNSLERDFLSAARATRSRERRRRRSFTASVALLLALALVAGVVAWQQNLEGDRRRAEATARRVAFLADSMRGTDPVLAMRLSVAAWRTSGTSETKGALFAADTQPERAVFHVPVGSDGHDPFLSADGRTLVTEGSRWIQRWNVVTRRPDGKVEKSADDSLTDVSSDGHRLLMTLGSGGFQVRDARSGTVIGTFRLWSGASQVELGPGGRTLIVVGDKFVQLWDVPRHRLLLEPKVAEAQTALISPDDRLMALCPSTEGPLQVWDVVGRRRVSAPWVRAAGRSACEGYSAFGAGGLLAVTTDDGVRVWDTASGRRRDLPELDQDDASEVAFSADGRYLAVTGGRTVAVWRMAGTPRVVLQHTPRNEVAGDGHIDPEAGVIRYLVTAGGRPAAVKTVAFDTAAEVQWHQRAIARQARFSPDGRFVGTARLVGNTAVFELRPASGSIGTRLTSAHCESDDEDDECVVNLTFSPDGRAFAYGTGTFDGPSTRGWPERIRVWDTRRKRETVSLDIAPRDPDATLDDGVVLGPDRYSLLVYRTSADAWERWDLRTRHRTARHRIRRPGDGPLSWAEASHSMALRPDGRLLATSYSALVELPSGRSVARELSRDGTSTVLAFSPSGDRLVVGDDMGWVSVWDQDGRRRLAELAGTLSGDFTAGPYDVTALAFSPDGSTLAVGGLDGTITLWDVNSAQQLGFPLPTSGDKVLDLSFTPDGRTLQVAGEHIPLRTYPVDPDRIAATVCRRAGGGLTRDQWHTYLPELPYRNVC
ncbi:nSTAND1 domain-containing NTPase [Streptomyces sp. NPDC001348]